MSWSQLFFVFRIVRVMSKKMENFTISLEYVEKNDFFQHIEFAMAIFQNIKKP